jgi:phosphopentomutase
MYPKGFLKSVLEILLPVTGYRAYLGNRSASGTQIITELGDEHVHTGFPIVYTSDDSVFQIAAHHDVISLERLYEICKITRERVLVDEHRVDRVIARPFIGRTENYIRTQN